MSRKVEQGRLGQRSRIPGPELRGMIERIIERVS
jgi:hypothetical protein